MDRIASTNNPVALVLAAGLSRRMGTPKPELSWGKTTLLGHMLKMVRSELKWPTVVVQGPHGSEIPGAITVRNPYPERGLSESLKLGIARAMDMAAGNGAIGVFLADQPFVTAADATMVWEALKTHEDSIAARPRYDGKWGHPVLLRVNRIGTGLVDLQGDQGLGAWLRDQREVFEIEIRVTDRPSPAWDLDTPDDYAEARDACARRND